MGMGSKDCYRLSARIPEKVAVSDFLMRLAGNTTGFDYPSKAKVSPGYDKTLQANAGIHLF
jgi:hypothetical protein